MSSQRRQRVADIYKTARDLVPAERDRYITQACAGDAEMKRQVETLLMESDEASDLLKETVSVDTDMRAFAAHAIEADDPMLGRRIGAYRIQREIGRGGMGAVYEAVRADNVFRKRVAIKLVKRGMDTDFILRRFRNERQILAALDHPNIARLLDGGTTDDARASLKQLQEMSDTRYVSPYLLAVIYGYLGQIDEAITQMTEAARIGDAWICWMLVDPQLDSLRADPRFAELLSQTRNPAISS